jgi:hypothetical protein
MTLWGMPEKSCPYLVFEDLMINERGIFRPLPAG